MGAALDPPVIRTLAHLIFMQNFAHTLSVARRQAGLSRTECAHLMGISLSHMSRLERGKADPQVTDFCGVALLFGRTMESLSGPLFAERAREMKERLFDLPEPRRHWLGQFNRTNALERLSDRIDRIIKAHGG
jgi:transcriptional regulator with XRE-family HTH domain